MVNQKTHYFVIWTESFLILTDRDGFIPSPIFFDFLLDINVDFRLTLFQKSHVLSCFCHVSLHLCKPHIHPNLSQATHHIDWMVVEFESALNCIRKS